MKPKKIRPPRNRRKTARLNAKLKARVRRKKAASPHGVRSKLKRKTGWVSQGV
jgi:hypothetical protein